MIGKSKKGGSSDAGGKHQSAYQKPYSKPNRDGDVWSRRHPWKKPGYSSPCYITEAATRARGLPDDCYELAVLRMFRREYVAALPEGEEVLADYRERAPKIVRAIEQLSGEGSRKVWECLYVTGIVPAVLFITSGEWEEAYRLYRSMCGEIEAIFLADCPESRDPQRSVDAWVHAKLAEVPRQAWDAATSRAISPEEVSLARHGREAGSA